MKILKILGVTTLKVIKLDPVKAVLYEIARIGITHGLKRLTKSTKNPLDDRMVEPVINALSVKLK